MEKVKSQEELLAQENKLLAELQSDQIKNHYKQSQNLTALSEVKNEKNIVSKDLAALKERVDDIKPMLTNSERLINEYKIELDKISHIFSSVQLKRDTHQQLSLIHI